MARLSRQTPRRVIFTTMKNEGPFVLEWVAYYLSLGFSGFVVCTNDCADGTDRIVERLEELGIASHRPNRIRPGNNPQHKALGRVRSHPWVQDAHWLLGIDVDEFLNIRVGDRTLDAFIDAIGEVDAVSLTWKLFGCGGIESFEDRPVTEQFFLCDHEETPSSGRAHGFKTMFRNNGTFRRFNPHRPKNLAPGRDEADVRWSDCGGNLRPMAQIGWRSWDGFSHAHARLHHYSVRSVENFLVKRDRGRTNHIKRDQTEHYWADMNVNLTEDRSILPLVDRMRPVLDELMADPILAALHAEAVTWHRAKIAELRAREDWTDFRAWLAAHKMGAKTPAVLDYES
ncbi:glycosyltransferase family 2 protein [Roseovarius salis]|uniref:glycosyltransferase family 2 protein n=1 Tax=Roseovarius salis TaxID=3376063 RepID=UPI0037CBA135